jgi:hypothetical protein
VALETGQGGAPSFFTAELAPDGTPIVAWLGRGTGETRPGTMQLLLSSSSDLGGTFRAPALAASNVCPCCRPAIAADDAGHWYLAWRDTDESQVRNVVVAMSKDRGATWSEPVPVPGPDWRIQGCPHAGPDLQVHEGELFVTWYTEASGDARLFASRSSDGGRSFEEPIDLAGRILDPNHPEFATMDRSLFVVFQGRDGAEQGSFGRTGVYLREIGFDASPIPIAVPRGSGSAAYPTLSALGPDKLLVAWTDASETGAVAVTARARVARR